MSFSIPTVLTGVNETICRINPALCGRDGAPQLPPNIRVTTLPNGTPQISSGGTTLDKLLAALTTNLAIIKGAGYIPTTQQPDNSASIYQQQALAQALQQQQLLQNQGSVGANFGASIEQFVTQNTGLILIGVVALVLFKSGRK